MEAFPFGASNALKSGTQPWRKVLNCQWQWQCLKTAEDEVAITVIDGRGAKALLVFIVK